MAYIHLLINRLVPYYPGHRSLPLFLLKSQQNLTAKVAGELLHQGSIPSADTASVDEGQRLKGQDQQTQMQRDHISVSSPATHISPVCAQRRPVPHSPLSLTGCHTLVIQRWVTSSEGLGSSLRITGYFCMAMGSNTCGGKQKLFGIFFPQAALGVATEGKVSTSA